MKYNYIYFEDKNSKVFRVTICYSNGKYSYAIQNPKDMFVKKIGRELALNQFNNGYYFYGCGHNWIDIKNSFILQFFYDVINRYKVLPKFFHKATLLKKPRLKIVEC